MKIRTDFVTNSSSSSYCTIRIEGKDVDLKMDLEYIGFYTFWFHDPEKMLRGSKNTDDLMRAIEYALCSDGRRSIKDDYVRKQLETIPDVSSLDSITFNCHEEIADRDWNDPWPRDVDYTYDFKSGAKSVRTSASWKSYKGYGDPFPPTAKDLSGNPLPFLADDEKGRLCILECKTDVTELEIPETIIANGQQSPVGGIGSACFAKARRLEKLTLPPTVDYIAPDALKGCRKTLETLRYVGVDAVDPYFVKDDKKLNLVFSSEKILIISEDITDLGEFVFGGCWNLKRIVLHDGMKKPTIKALSSASSLKEVELTDGNVVNITEDAAKKCFVAKKGVVRFDYKKYATMMAESGNAPAFKKAINAGDFSPVDIKELYEIVKLKRKPEFKQIKDILVGLGATKKLSAADQAELEVAEEKKQSKKPTIAELRKDKRYKNWKIKMGDDRKSIVIESYTGNEENLEIPSEMGGLPVTKLDSGWFASDHKPIKTITIPASISVIKSYFGNLENLERFIVDPENAYFQSINGSLYNKDATELLEIPYKVAIMTITSAITTLPDLRLKNMTIRDSIEVEEGNRCFTSIDGVLYNKDATKLIKAPVDLESVSVPETVISIAQGAFANCEKMSSVLLSESLRSIGEKAFCHCEALTKISIPAGIKTLESYVFYQCHNLQNVALTNGLERIKSYAFGECDSLRKLAIPISVSSIDRYSFNDCHDLKVVLLGAETHVYDPPFGNCAADTCEIIHST